MTKRDIKAKINALGLVAQWRGEWGEWRITVPPGSMHHIKTIDDAAREDIASYTSDDEDALDTATALRKHLEANPPPGFKAPWAYRIV